MDQKSARAAAAKAFKASKVALRKGHWRLPGPEVHWYVDLRADGPRPGDPLRFEVGAWVSALDQPEPEGGAVDCPLLADVPLDSGTSAAVADGVHQLVDLLAATGTVTALRDLLATRRLGDPLVDRDLRRLLQG